MTGEQMREVRALLGLSRQSFAVKLGVEASSVYRWETGRARIPIYLELAVRYLEKEAVT